MSLQNIRLSYSKYFGIIQSCLYDTINAKCPITGFSLLMRPPCLIESEANRANIQDGCHTLLCAVVYE